MDRKELLVAFSVKEDTISIPLHAVFFHFTVISPSACCKILFSVKVILTEQSLHLPADAFMYSQFS